MHGSEIICPTPLQVGHSATWVKLPNGVLVALLTCPLPPHVVQVVGHRAEEEASRSGRQDSSRAAHLGGETVRRKG